MTTLRSSASLTLLDKVNVCLQDFGDHVMHLIFDVQGPLHLERLQQALRLSLEQHPIMAMRLDCSGLQPKWIPHTPATLAHYEFCEHHLLNGGSGNHSLQHAIDEFMLQQFDYQRVPMVKVRVIQHVTQSSQTHDATHTICIKVSCVPIDGRGFLIYVEDVLALYEKLGLNPSFRPQPGTLNLRSTKALVPYFRPRDLLPLLFHGLKHQLQDSRTAHNWEVPCAPGNAIHKRYLCHQCSPRTLQALTRFRRQHGLSFNDVLLGAYYLALHEQIQPEHQGPFCVLNTYDLRRYETDKAPHRVANYSSFINTNVTLSAGSTLLQVARAVQDAIHQRKQHYPGITEGPFIWPLLTFLPFGLGSRIVKFLLKHRGEKIPVFTNVGVIPVERMRFNGMPIRNVRPFAPLEYPPKLTVTLATAGEVISLSVGYSDRHFATDNMRRLFTRMEQLIQATCTQTVTEAA
ncbi:hypothetical protein [Ketobacter sp.]|uniref:hypothetical protein n=1 Tax=Ketobacter sp. TaxID=2083498 RepID=UPI000F167B1B|nr:hypothetical protein [Ketobacter sp.]RLT96883.1 MAG: hypothetical protein D9N14_12705 [Ketobacter sp.]